MKNLALLAVLALAGCPMTEPGEGGSVLVGNWQEVPSITSDEPAELDLASFEGDGSFRIQSDTEITEGTYVEGDLLVLTTDTGDIQELPYAVDGQQFTPIGLRHVGAGAGFEGEWRAEATNNGETQAMVLVLGADGRFALDIDDDHLTGAWRDEDGELITTLEFPDDEGNVIPFDLPWHSIDGSLSIVAFQRLGEG